MAHGDGDGTTNPANMGDLSSPSAAGFDSGVSSGSNSTSGSANIIPADASATPQMGAVWPGETVPGIQNPAPQMGAVWPGETIPGIQNPAPQMGAVWPSETIPGLTYGTAPTITGSNGKVEPIEPPPTFTGPQIPDSYQPVGGSSAGGSTSTGSVVTASEPGGLAAGSNQIIVQSGDTLGGIAEAHGMSLGQIMALNPQITDPNLINTGARINVGGANTSLAVSTADAHRVDLGPSSSTTAAHPASSVPTYSPNDGPPGSVVSVDGKTYVVALDGKQLVPKDPNTSALPAASTASAGLSTDGPPGSVVSVDGKTYVIALDGQRIPKDPNVSALPFPPNPVTLNPTPTTSSTIPAPATVITPSTTTPGASTTPASSPNDGPPGSVVSIDGKTYTVALDGQLLPKSPDVSALPFPPNPVTPNPTPSAATAPVTTAPTVTTTPTATPAPSPNNGPPGSVVFTNGEAYTVALDGQLIPRNPGVTPVSTGPTPAPSPNNGPPGSVVSSGGQTYIVDLDGQLSVKSPNVSALPGGNGAVTSTSSPSPLDSLPGNVLAAAEAAAAAAHPNITGMP